MAVTEIKEINLTGHVISTWWPRWVYTLCV